MAIREIIFVVSDSGAVTPTAPQHGGVQGEHNAATVTFVLPSNFVSDDYFYRIDCRDTVGHYDTTGRIVPSVSEGKTMLWTSIPSAWTRYGGMLTLSVVVSQVIDGTEEKTIFSADGRVSLTARNVDDSEVKGGLSALIQDCEETTAECEELIAGIRNDLEAGAFEGKEGPQGERGPQGEKGDPGAVSYETLTPEQKKELTAEGTALCAAVAAGVTTIEQNNNTPLKFWVGTQDEYDAIETKEEGTFYIVSDDKTFETLVASLNSCEAEITQLKTHLNEGLISLNGLTDAEVEILAEAAIQEKYKAMPDNTFARYCVDRNGSYVFYELYKTVNGWGHMERIRYASRFYREVQGKQQGTTAVTYTFGTWHQFATVAQ